MSGPDRARAAFRFYHVKGPAPKALYFNKRPLVPSLHFVIEESNATVLEIWPSRPLA